MNLPVILRFEVIPLSRGSIPVFTGFYVRGFFYSVLNSVDKDLAFRIHEFRGVKPFAITPIRPINKPMEVVNGVWLVESDVKAVFEIKFLRDDLANIFMQGVFGLDDVKIGDCSFAINSVNVRKEDFKDLLNKNFSGRIGLEFHTPTYFSIRGRPFPYLFPDIRKLTVNLLNIWNSYAPEELRFDSDAALKAVEASTYVRSHQIKTREIRFEDVKLAGFLGKVEIVYSKTNKEGAKYLTPLLHMAEYSNVGEKRTYGFGVVTVKYLQ